MNLVNLPHPNKFLIVEPLDYPNPYDFKTHHRHDYFEIILIKKGGGEQLIDFTRTKLKSNSIYVIYPRQIHLLRREAAQGLIIQFKKEIFDFIFPLQHHYLYFANPELLLDKKDFDHLYELTQNVLSFYNDEKLSSFSIHKSFSYLQIILINLIEHHQKLSLNSSDNFAGQFLQWVSLNIKENRKVTDFAKMMNMSADKLTALCKEFLGTTPLKIIHEELLIEIKRLMVLGQLTLKEIAYELNFESASNFSSFVKTATGLTPSELQEKLKRDLY